MGAREHRWVSILEGPPPEQEIRRDVRWVSILEGPPPGQEIVLRGILAAGLRGPRNGRGGPASLAAPLRRFNSLGIALLVHFAVAFAFLFIVVFGRLADAGFLSVSMADLPERQEAREEAPPAEPTTKECPFCLSTIPIKATRCAYCISELSVR